MTNHMNAPTYLVPFEDNTEDGHTYITCPKCGSGHLEDKPQGNAPRILAVGQPVELTAPVERIDYTTVSEEQRRELLAKSFNDAPRRSTQYFCCADCETGFDLEIEQHEGTVRAQVREILPMPERNTP